MVAYARPALFLLCYQKLTKDNFLVGRAFADAHAVEGTVDKEEGNDEKGSGEDVRQDAPL